MPAKFRGLLQFDIGGLIMLIALVALLTASWTDLQRQREQIEELHERIDQLESRVQSIVVW